MTLQPLIKYLKETPTFTWLLLFLASLLITTQAMRHNNLEMIKYRDALYAADQRGQGVDKALNDLRAYVYAHMNTNLSSSGNSIKPPIQLKYTYERLVKAEQQRVNEANDRVQLQAQDYCQQAGGGQYRQGCFEQYVDSHHVKVKKIPAALFQFDFISPAWSPDLAGWSLLAAIVLGLAFLASFLADRLAGRRIKRRFADPA